MNNNCSSSSGQGKRRRQQQQQQQLILPAMINRLDEDTLCIIFAFLDLFDLVRCSLVSNSWNLIIKRSRLLHTLYLNHLQRYGSSNSISKSNFDSRRPLSSLIQDLAMHCHRSSLIQGPVHVDQWKAHTTGVNQCRMKMGLVLTGVGDKVIRLWSSKNYRCLEEYSLSDIAPLVDFDFDETKIVGLSGTRICIWRRQGDRTLFPSREGTFTKGLCMRYMDPDAVVGCEDGTIRIFDMYSRSCSQIIRTHSCPVTCLALGEDQLILSGSSLGSVTVSSLQSDQRVATLKSADRIGIKTLCYNPSSQLVFAGSTSGYAACWDLRKMSTLWETRVSPNVIYSMQHLQSDTSTLVVGGIDGVLYVLDQNTGEVLSRCTVDEGRGGRSLHGSVERKKVKRLAEDVSVGSIAVAVRPPIKCLAVGMKKVVTIHNSEYITMWKFNNRARPAG